MLEIKEYVDIKEYSTLHMGGQLRYFVIIQKKEDLTSLYAIAQSDVRYKDTPIFILGGGSNVVFSDGVIDVFALKIEIKGLEIIPARPRQLTHDSEGGLAHEGAGGKETNEFTDIKVGAGENWDKIVEKTVAMNLSGLESLSAIPGTVGATPVQNVGAYGSEVKDTILEVEVFNIEEKTISKISNKDCKFGYRDSIFKKEAKGKYIITSVTYRLNKSLPTIPKYPGVIKYFEDREIVNPTLLQIRDAIIYIRSEKLPNPKEIPNVGSFFKNPIVLTKIADKIKEEYTNTKFFPIDDTHTKIPAGWLIENAGLKGKSFGEVSVYNKNALVLVNTKDAKFEDIISARDEIIKIVREKFGIVLEQEPEIV